MTASQSASALLRTLGLPRGSAAVWPVTRDGAVALVVRLDPALMARMPDLPKSFEGYRVLVEPNKPIGTQLRLH